jgi:hypothetical protein
MVAITEEKEISTERFCTCCGKWIKVDGFHKNQSRCKACNYAMVKEWRKRNPDKLREQYRRKRLRKKERNRRERVKWTGEDSFSKEESNTLKKERT